MDRRARSVNGSHMDMLCLTPPVRCGTSHSIYRCLRRWSLACMFDGAPVSAFLLLFFEDSGSWQGLHLNNVSGQRVVHVWVIGIWKSTKPQESRSVLYWLPICSGCRIGFRSIGEPIATPGLHNPDAGSSLDPLADQYALERGLLRPTAMILWRRRGVKRRDGMHNLPAEPNKRRYAA